MLSSPVLFLSGSFRRCWKPPIWWMRLGTVGWLGDIDDMESAFVARYDDIMISLTLMGGLILERLHTHQTPQRG